MMLFAIVIYALCPLSASFPGGIPSAEISEGWERFSGEGFIGKQFFVYELYVNPKLSGVYSITRYRSCRNTINPNEVDAPSGNEILIWNSQPEKKKPLMCFELVEGSGSNHKQSPVWREISRDSDRYRSLMMNVIQIYMLHRENMDLEPLR